MTEEQNKLAEEEPEAMKWFRKGRESVLRKNQSGCCCLFNEEDEIVSVCAAHEEWAALREPATDAVRWRKCVQDGEFPICRDGIWMHVDRVTGKILTGGSPEEVIDAATDRALKGKGASQNAAPYIEALRELVELDEKDAFGDTGGAFDPARALLSPEGASQGDEERIYTKADMEAACALVLAGFRSKPMLNKMVDRFLAWPLPFSVCADLIATRQEHGRIGTNLLTATEARQMLEHVLAPDEQKG